MYSPFQETPATLPLHPRLPLVTSGYRSMSEMSGSTSASLLERARTLERDAWCRLVHLYGPLVYRWARQAGLQSSDASDVGQETFRTVAMRIPDFRLDRPGDSFRGWLWGITQLKLKEFYRQRAAEPVTNGGNDVDCAANEVPEQPLDNSASGSNADTKSRLMRRTLELIRTDFQPQTWQAFWRSAVDNEKTRDIAEELGMSQKAVRQAKHRVLRRLREELENLE